MAVEAKVAVLAVAAVAGLAGCGGDDGTVSGESPSAPQTIKLGAPFKGKLPTQFTCDGVGKAPTFTVANLPPKTKSLALLAEDPDVSGGSFVHWALFDVDPQAKEIPNGIGKPLTGRNSAGREDYEPACPPKGAPAHHYVFSIYALKQQLRLGQGAAPEFVRQGIRDQAIAKGVATATYSRK